MARLAAIGRPRHPAHMLSVIEFHIEVLIETRRKSLERRRCTFDVAVADDTHRNGWGHKLCEMTFGTGVVTREPGRGGIVASGMTSSAR